MVWSRKKQLKRDVRVKDSFITTLKKKGIIPYGSRVDMILKLLLMVKKEE